MASRKPSPSTPSGDLSTASLEALVLETLKRLGEDPAREGLARTPKRVADSLKYLTAGHAKLPKDVLNGAVFEHEADEMIVVRDIELYSMCEHHMLPFFGRAHVAYLPQGKIIGLSKIPRDRRLLRAPPAGAGAAHDADREGHRGDPRSPAASASSSRRATSA